MNTLLDGTGGATAMPAAVLEFLGSVFLHSLWQAAAVAGGLAAVLACVPRSSAAALRLRYVACVIALVAVPLLAVTAAARSPAVAGWAAGSLSVSAAVVHRLAPWLATCGLAWATGIGFGMLRMAVGWSLSRRLVAAARCDHRLEQHADRWRAALGICGRVRVRVSAAVTVPVLVGVARPVILWPAATFTGFAAEHIEAILVHELAHVRRHDAVVNLLQAVIETTFFHHPAVWWISAQVRGEREHCADELAVAVLGESNAANRLRYATALVMLEERQRGRPALAIASDGGCLVARIRRLAGASERPQRGARFAAASSIVMIAAISGVTLGVADRGAQVPPAARPSQADGDAASAFAGAAPTSPRVLDEPTLPPAPRCGTPKAEPAARLLPAPPTAVVWSSQISDDLRARATALFTALPRLSPGVLRLTTLTSLSADVAAVVGRLRTDELELGSNGSVTVQEVRAAARQRWRRVSIVSLTTLCPEMADAIAGLSCVEIDLPDIQTLSPATAATLARFQGRRISLGGLENLQAELVAAFAAYAGTLHLPGVTAVDADTAEAIASLTCAVSLPNLQHALPAVRGPQSGRRPVMIPIGAVFRLPSPVSTALLRVAHVPGREPGS
jgi:beta-lactamase regulating signal transducer with metallopeptidase domain